VPQIRDIFFKKLNFCVVDNAEKQRSSTWSIRVDSKNVYLFVNTFGGKMKVSFHPVTNEEVKDGKDSQHGLVGAHAQGLRGSGFVPPQPHRWNRGNKKEVLNLAAQVLLPIDYMTGEVFQYSSKKKPHFAFKIKEEGLAIEIALFFHYLENNDAVSKIKIMGYSHLVSYPQGGKYKVSVAVRQVKFNRSNLPEAGSYPVRKLSEYEFASDENLHAICFNFPKDSESLQLIETNGNFNIT